MGFLIIFVVVAIAFFIFGIVTKGITSFGDVIGYTLMSGFTSLVIWLLVVLITSCLYSSWAPNEKQYDQIDSESYVMVVGLDEGAVFYNKPDGHYNFAYYDESGTPIGVDTTSAKKVSVHTGVVGESPRITIHYWVPKNKIVKYFVWDTFVSYEIFLPNDSYIKIKGLDQNISDW